MKQGLQLRIGHQLSMTPQLQQAIKLLQLSSVDLHLEIQQALYSNPMLELAEEMEQSAEQQEKTSEAPPKEQEPKNFYHNTSQLCCNPHPCGIKAPPLQPGGVRPPPPE